MNNGDLLLRIYKTGRHEACLHLRARRECFKITGLIGVLPFVGQLKQLAKAIDSGAAQQCTLSLHTTKGAEHALGICFSGDTLSVELLFAGQSRFCLQLSARAFIASVEGMLAKLPKFF